MAKSKFFHVEEWSSSHPLATPYPEEWIEERWRPLAEMLDRIRLAIGSAIKVTPNGGYRAPEHNRAIGGAQDSQHAQGRAADIVAPGRTAAELYRVILRLYEGGALPELSGLGVYDGFVHVDVGGPRRPDGSPRRWGTPPKRKQQP